MTGIPEIPAGMGIPLGMVVDGSLGQGVEVRLDPATSVEEVKVGTFVTLQGEKLRFFGVVTDVKLGAASPGLKYNLPDVNDPFIAEVVSGATVFGSLSVLPSLTMPAVLGDEASPSPAKTIPPHFARAYLASERDVQAVFGSADERHFWIGNPLDMETKVCLDLKSLIERSMGIFGKSGTGKTFLTRLLLVGILQSDLASTLIFDMHSEYGWQGRDAERNRQVKGLKQLFGSKVAVFSLDEKSSRQRGLSPDEVVRISYGDIEPEDIEALRENLGLSDVAAQAAYNLKQRLGPGKWLEEFLGLGAGMICRSCPLPSTYSPKPWQPFTTACPGSSGTNSWCPRQRRTRCSASWSTWTGECTWCWSSVGTATTPTPTSWWPTCSPAASTRGTCSVMKRRKGAAGQGHGPWLSPSRKLTSSSAPPWLPRPSSASSPGSYASTA